MKYCNLLFTTIIFLLGASVSAKVVLPNLFSDNMVLQRNAEVKLWGWGSPFEEVVVTTGWDNKEYKLKPDNHAAWQLTVKTPGAGGPYTIHFKGQDNTVRLQNVMLGEVWLCSGQSNMEWSANMKIDNAEAEIAAANYPDIRFYTVPKMASPDLQMNLPEKWQVCTPETMRHFSAVGYYFARYLREDLKGVAIGVINSSWGGTPAEPWIPESYVTGDPTVAEAAKKLRPSEWWPSEPGRTYNAMIKPLLGYKLAGVLWYQGESNQGSFVYDKTLACLIRSWRKEWDTDFPFYFVQIAPFNYGDNTELAAVIRDAQRRVLGAVDNTGMVLTSDISSIDELHPPNKKSVGQRLANLALTNHYKIDKGVVNGPLYKSFEVKGNSLSVYFENANGLKFKDKPSTWFEVAGEDGIWYKAIAKIVKNTVVLTSKEVKRPVKARYAWSNIALADLFNVAGLPASTFTTEK